MLPTAHSRPALGGSRTLTLVASLSFIQEIHGSTERDYLLRVVEHDKATCAVVSKRFDLEYFDGDRRFGYGGYRYDGRWRPFAERLALHYGLRSGMRVLDIGCAKGFLLHDLREAVPGLHVEGIDVSSYAIANAMEDISEFVRVGDAVSLPYDDGSFDLVLSINTLHNLELPDLERALLEIERVGRGRGYIVVDGYRTDREKVNLMYWHLTCECFFTPAEWEWLFARIGYRGDYECIFYG